MQAANVIAIHTQSQDSDQSPHTALNSYPDIEAIHEWLKQAIHHVEKSQLNAINNLDPEPWFYYSPYLVIMSEETEYAIEVFSNLCKDLHLDFTKLPQNSDIAKACLGAFMTPKSDVRVLLIPEILKLSDDVEESIVEDIHSLMDKSSTQAPVLIVTIGSPKQYIQMSETLRAPGRFDNRIVLNTKSPIQHAQSFIHYLPTELRDESLNDNIETLGKLVSIEFAEERRMSLFAINLIRNAKLLNSKISFKDVVRIAQTSSTQTRYQEIPQIHLEQIAVHECGHAVMTMLSTDGANIPEYITINESVNYAGIVVGCYDYQYAMNSKPNYKDLLNTIRITLAGRAATILYYDIMEYRYAGEYSDFRKANDIARDLIEDYGLVPPQSANNLHYSFCNLRGKETASYIDRINALVEQLLDYEYENVNKILKQHQSFLHNMIQTVLLKKELFQDELTTMWQNYSEKPVLNTCANKTPIFLK